MCNGCEDCKCKAAIVGKIELPELARRQAWNDKITQERKKRSQKRTAHKRATSNIHVEVTRA